MSTIQFIGAGAGSGKTHRLTHLLYEKLESGAIQPAGVIATTFTIKAAAELRQRVRETLLENNRFALATAIGQARIGTVNSVCGQLVQRFAFELGLSPELEVIEEEESTALLRESIDSVLTDGDYLAELFAITRRLGLEDWQATIKSLVDKARANGIDADALRQMGQTNADHLLATCFPLKGRDSFDAELSKAIDLAIAGLEAEQASAKKPIKKTATAITTLRHMASDLESKALAWKDWVGLMALDPAKSAELIVEPVIDLARQGHDAHPGLQADLRAWLVAAFDLAARTLDAFATRKRDRGVLDFVDQERLLLAALDRPDVQESLRKDLQLLMVDEFQDTSPIQLALFARLADLAQETVWVGDIKQAIYGFRGSDANLMRQVLAELDSANAGDKAQRPQRLNESRRSRPELVALVNAVFTHAFADTLQPQDICLRAHRPATLDNSAFAWWRLSGGKKEARMTALGAAVRTVIDSGYEVVDKASGQARPVQAGDIAILARTHTNVLAAAQGLRQAGLAVTSAQPGLLQTPEAVLVVACLRRLLDANDTLATAEIYSLTQHGATPEVWLADRLEWLAAGKPSQAWTETEPCIPLLVTLAKMRDGAARNWSPAEALRRVIADGALSQHLVRWGPDAARAANRMDNLDVLQSLATDYEAHCHASRRAASIGGLLLWLRALGEAKEDAMAERPGAAIRVLTHHAAKGLEWPVVICLDLDHDPRDDLWGMSVEATADRLDIRNPLAGRFIRYWPWPYGKRSKDMTVLQRLQGADVAATVDPILRRASDEARRLLYVSMTRARDLLVFAVPDKADEFPWFETLDAPWLKFDELPNDARLSLPEGHGEIPVALLNQDPSICPPLSDADKFEGLWWVSGYSGGRSLLPAKCAPSTLSAVSPAPTFSKQNAAPAFQLENYGNRFGITDSPAMDVLGNALHACIAFDWINPDLADRRTRISEILALWGMAAHVDSDAVMSGVDAFRAWCYSRWQIRRALVEYPFARTLANGQRLSGRLDLLLDTDDGWVIVDHKSNPSPRDKLAALATEYLPQLNAYAETINALGDQRPISLAINFFVGQSMAVLPPQSLSQT